MGKRVYTEKKLDRSVRLSITNAKINNLMENIEFEENHIAVMSQQPAGLNLVTGSNEQLLQAARARVARMKGDLKIQNDELSRLLGVEGSAS